jgi:hypothetical protein
MVMLIDAPAPAGAGDIERRQADRPGAAKRARATADRPARQQAVARHLGAGAQLGRHPGGIEPGDRARGERAQVVRIEHVEQRLRKFRVIVVEALGHPRIEERERFDHAFDVRVFAHPAANQEAPRDLRIADGEFT